ncbi:MAG: sulfatase-like hydrolase/transferase [Chitinivibrionales bacterium]|nr:sulfatase-like hydrolase/transferase [Chitinivibrionales bacterium]
MATKPHIIIFNPDQWRGDVLGHLDNPAAVTPNLDRMVATDGVSFRRAYCQNPVCTPSRCSFMTGWYPHTRGHRTMHYMLRDHEGETNLLRVLRDNGYLVYWGGKNDLVPGQNGFARDADVKFTPTDDDYRRWGHTPKPGLHSWTPWRGERDSDTWFSFMAGKLPTDDDDIYCDNDWAHVLGAIDFIRRYDGDQPVCIYLPLLYPHPPYGVEDPWFSLIQRDKLPPRTPTPEGWQGKPSILEGIWERQNLRGWSEERWTELRATYYGMCARLDHQFGMLMDALVDKGMYDDSAVFLFSDHGDFTGDYGLVEKTQNTLEEFLTRVPFVIKPPKSTPVEPRVSDALVELVDFPATVYALTGIEPPYWHFGRSLLPVLAGDTDEHRDAVFCEGGRLENERQADEHQSTGSQADGSSPYWPRIQLQIDHSHPYHSKAAMCRTATHKYIRRLYEQDELYDLSRDPSELHNVIDDPAYAGTLAALKDRMLTWYQETADVVPLEGDHR